MTRTRVLAALLAGLTLAGVGTAATALGDDGPAAAAPVTVVAQSRTTTSTSTPTGTPAVDAGAIPADTAAARAVAHLGGGTAVKIESESEHGRASWKVDVRRGTGVTEVHVDAAGGAITRIDGERGDDRGSDDRHGDDRYGDDRGRHGGDDHSDDHGGRHGGDDDRGDDRSDNHSDDHGGRHGGDDR